MLFVGTRQLTANIEHTVRKQLLIVFRTRLKLCADDHDCETEPNLLWEENFLPSTAAAAHFQKDLPFVYIANKFVS